MAVRRRILAELATAALVVAGPITGVAAVAHTPSTLDKAVVVAAEPLNPKGCAGCGNGEA
ncbi:hypothetical protein [Asanoa iriomotensis]|uniref:Uncharacterized protein n=1 Tax=Asanoa iriomotensis TaxID=234613 RepID=A0ABQ4C347_9ACTN|nr:hypothetical protein [Asanoa iriomotensis]GIF56710.1 hypothetical protein Air01nite_28050 [Asanoa iriomotensis]